MKLPRNWGSRILPISERFLKIHRPFSCGIPAYAYQQIGEYMKTKKNLFTHLNIQMAAFFLAANFIFLLICSALYYQWAFQILLENSEKLHIQSMQQTQHRIEQTLDEADRAVNLLSYGNTGQKILAHSGSETDIDSILLFRNYLEQVSGILRSYSSIYSIYFTPATIC